MNPLEKILLSLALKEGFITKNQIQKCQQLKEARFPNRTVSQLLVAQGFLTADQFRILKQHAQRYSASLSKSKMEAQKGGSVSPAGQQTGNQPSSQLPSPSSPNASSPPSSQSSGVSQSGEVSPNFAMEKKKDRNFGLICIKLGFATEDEVKACILEQNKLQEGGLFVRLGEIMMEKGILTIQQVEKILNFQKKTILNCTGCGARYNISNYKPGKKVRCRKCSTILVVPESLDSAQAEDSIYMEDSEAGFAASGAGQRETTHQPGGEEQTRIQPPEGGDDPFSSAHQTGEFQGFTEEDSGVDFVDESEFDSFDQGAPFDSQGDFGEIADSKVETHFGASDDFEEDHEDNYITNPSPEESRFATGVDKPAPKVTERRQGDRRKGEDRRKKQKKISFPDRRRGGDRRKRRRRRDGEDEEDKSQKTLQMILIGSLAMGAILIVVLLFVITVTPMKKEELKRAKQTFSRAFEKARADREKGYYDEALKAFNQAMEAGKKYNENASDIDDEFKEKKKACDLEGAHLKSYLEAVRKKDYKALVPLMEKLTAKEKVLKEDVAIKLAQNKHPAALPFFAEKLKAFEGGLSPDLVKVISRYRNTDHEKEALEILSEALTKAIRSVETRRRNNYLGKAIPHMIRAVTAFSGPKAITVLSRVVEYSETGTYIYEAVKGLNQIGGKETLPALIKALSNQRRQIREEAEKGIIQAGVFALPYLSKIILKSESHSPPVEAIRILTKMTKVLGEPAFDAFRKILKEAKMRSRWDLCFYSMTKLVNSESNLPNPLKETMRQVIGEICKTDPDRINKTYYTGFFAVAQYLNMQQEQLKILSWMERLHKLPNFSKRDIPDPRFLGTIPRKKALVEVVNDTPVRVILLFKTDVDYEVLEIPSRSRKSIEFDKGTLYDVFGVSYDSSRPPYFGKFLFDLKKKYQITLRR